MVGYEIVDSKKEKIAKIFNKIQLIDDAKHILDLELLKIEYNSV